MRPEILMGIGYCMGARKALTSYRKNKRAFLKLQDF
jgi:hypothetical protein